MGRETNLSISPFFVLEFLPNQRWETWQLAVDHDLFELKKRVSNLERGQCFWSRQRTISGSLRNQSSNRGELSNLDICPLNFSNGSESVRSFSPSYQRVRTPDRLKRLDRRAFSKKRKSNWPLSSSLPDTPQLRAAKSASTLPSNNHIVLKSSSSKGHVRHNSIPALFEIKTAKLPQLRAWKSGSFNDGEAVARKSSNCPKTNLQIPASFPSGSYFGNGYYSPRVKYSPVKPRPVLCQTPPREDEKVEHEKSAPLASAKSAQSHKKSQGVKPMMDTQTPKKLDENLEKANLRANHTRKSYRDTESKNFDGKRSHIRQLLRMTLAEK